MKILKVVLIYTKSSYKWYMLKYDKVICTFLKKWCRNPNGNVIEVGKIINKCNNNDIKVKF